MTNFPKLHCLETSFRSNTTDSAGMMKWGREAFRQAGRERAKAWEGRNPRAPSPTAHTPWGAWNEIRLEKQKSRLSYKECEWIDWHENWGLKELRRVWGGACPRWDSGHNKKKKDKPSGILTWGLMLFSFNSPATHGQSSGLGRWVDWGQQGGHQDGRHRTGRLLVGVVMAWTPQPCP